MSEIPPSPTDVFCGRRVFEVPPDIASAEFPSGSKMVFKFHALELHDHIEELERLLRDIRDDTTTGFYDGRLFDRRIAEALGEKP